MPNQLPSTLAGALNLYAGDDYSFPLALADSNGDPVDLTGWTFTSAWRKNVNSDVEVPLVVDPTDLETGHITLVINSDATTAMVAEEKSATVRGVWDVQGYDGATTTTFLRGTSTTVKDVTRA